MKVCTNCGENKLNENFNNQASATDGKANQCRDCVILKRRDVTSRNRHFVWGYLLASPCVDCGETDRVVLQFDHKDNVDKLGNLSDMVNQSATIEAITEEISKCDVRCANCHQRRTAIQQNWYSY